MGGQSVIGGHVQEGEAAVDAQARCNAGIGKRMVSGLHNERTGSGLVDRGVLDGSPRGVVYQLTESGRAMGPGLLKLGEWAERYMAPAARTRARQPSRRRLLTSGKLR